MKIAIISDSHDNMMTVKTFLDYAKENKIDQIIHCGDVTDLETLKYFSENFSGKIYLCDGNADQKFFTPKEVEIFSNIELYNKYGELEIDNLKICFTHYETMGRNYALMQKYDHVFYGHTHKPWQERIGRTLFSNPGTLAGLFYRASFAVWDTKTNKLELKILDRL